MKILKKLKGFSSDVSLVEIDGVRYVLKQCDPDEVVSEKKFNKELSDRGINTLTLIDNKDLKSNEILLEYVEDSKTLDDNFTESNCEKWGKLASSIHGVKYQSCFKYDEQGQKVELVWSDYLALKIERAFLKSKENDNYGFSVEEIEKIREYLSPLLKINLKEFSLIHGDFHSGNVLIKNGELILFDKNSEAFSGDYLLDLAVAIIDMPNGTLIQTDNPDNTNEKKYLNAFIEGYAYDFLDDPNFNRYIMLIAFGRLYTPFSKNYKDIIYSLLKKTNE